MRLMGTQLFPIKKIRTFWGSYKQQIKTIRTISFRFFGWNKTHSINFMKRFRRPTNFTVCCIFTLHSLKKFSITSYNQIYFLSIISQRYKNTVSLLGKIKNSLCYSYIPFCFQSHKQIIPYFMVKEER